MGTSSYDTVMFVSPSIFSRLVTGTAPDAKASEPAQDEAAQEPRPFREVVSDWRAELADRMREELASSPLTQLHLKSPHPGGLAQLYAEHPTKLSNLFRGSDVLERSQAEALDLLRQAQRLLNEYGLVTLYLSIGTASWDEQGQRRTSPVLLRPIDVYMDREGEIYLALRPGMEISNRLLMVLSRRGKPLDAPQILEAVRTRHGFSPEEALRLVRDAGADIPGFAAEDSLTVGVFSHPTSALLRELGAPQWLSLSPTVRALAGDANAAKDLEFSPEAANPNDRDPWEEVGIGEHSPQWADVVEAATGESSLVIELPPTEDAVPLVASLAAEHAAAGRSVLVVAPPGQPQHAIAKKLSDSGVAEVANVVGSTARSAEEVQRNLLEAMLDASDSFDADSTDEMRTKLRRRRQELSSYTESLHREFPEWGVSAFDALQVLTDLTSLPGGPTTRVRLDRDSLTRISGDGGDVARSLLQRAFELGMFSGDTVRNWWTGIEIFDEATITSVMDAVEELSERVLPQTERDMVSVQASTGLQLAQSVSQWQKELQLLADVQKCLDVFSPRVFERSAADMAVATASKDWRSERGISLRRSRRRSLVKQAKDLLVPGAHVTNLHAELVQVQHLREQWRSYAGSGTWPMVPADLGAVLATERELTDRLALINPYLEPVYGNLFELSIEELGGLLDALAGDPEGAKELPERVRVGRELDALGLGALVEDLQERRVAEETLPLELDLAWWATALSMMLREEPSLGGIDPTQLQEALQELRDLEGKQIASLGPAARSRIMRIRQQALAESAEDYDAIQSRLSIPMAAPAYYAQIPIAWEIMPIVITSASVVPQVVPWGKHVDVVILTAVEELPLAGLVPVIARGKQVVAVGSSAPGNSNLEQLKRSLPILHLPASPQHINTAVVSLVSQYEVESGAVSIPSRRPLGRLNLQVVNGTGMPAPGVHAIESSAAEVEAVVGKVRDHAHNQADMSLAVVALNDRHADRIRAALRSASTGDRQLKELLQGQGSEPFAVFGPQEATGQRRDRVILAVGFAKTPHGRVIHDFGAYSLPGGEVLLGQALRVARGQLDLVASFHAGDVDREKLRQPGAQMLVDLLALGREGSGSGDVTWPTLEVAPDHLLVDLAERLYSLGLNVVPNLGVPGGLRIPLAIGHPEVPEELLVAVLTDDDDYIAEPSLRVRDRMVPRLLEDQGWKVRIELSMAVFIDPNKEAEAIVQLVLDAVDEFYDQHPELRPAAGEGAEESVFTSEDLGLIDEPADLDHSLYGAPTVADISDEDVVTGVRVALPKEGRPLIAAGLPLSAYGDDQLDVVAQWVIGSSEQVSEEDAVLGVREFLDLRRKGAQSEAVLRNVVRRNMPTESAQVTTADDSEQDSVDE